jgi:hypothetical protein
MGLSAVVTDLARGGSAELAATETAVALRKKARLEIMLLRSAIDNAQRYHRARRLFECG